ncbi:hypothetical protein QBC33DRAFT_539370 [Phialemonium atrogriseum]|uniref:Uncharacterized protein n=1 Tax=Phialemonium atrogriseum TaxID=1093897 RepID=A0AAJ0C1U6_9PEZI|nr:uncharacterized protein QBC33DRAFT_539370 [Phialemonium atrogriseum]KAK1767152.1 hypothetical protein QBC33DRAFT_539370 [Phialemonium atrogriseum]
MPLPRKKRSSATAAGNSSSPTPTSQGIPGVVSPAPINQYCPDGNDSVIIPYDASGSPIVFNQEQPMSFRMHCNTYWAAMGPNPSVRDILVVYAPDMYACLCLCAAYNAGYSDAVGDDVAVGGGICVSAALVRGPAQFCHLQNATGENDTAGAFGNPVDTAVLVGDWAGLPAGNLTLAFGGNLPADQEVEDGAV